MLKRLKIRQLLLQAALRSLGLRIGDVDPEWGGVIDEDGPDWETYPILYHGLKNSCLPPVPEKTELKLRQTSLAIKPYADLQFLLLEEILYRTLQAGVKVCLLKGSALAGQYYPDVSLRPMGDIDILVPDNAREVMHRIMRAAGGCFEAARWSHDRYAFPRADGITVEVHHRLFDPRSLMQRYLFPTDFLKPVPWDRLIPLSNGAFRLPSGDEYDYLCLHALKEGYLSLKWMVDIVLMGQAEKPHGPGSSGFIRNAALMMKDIIAMLLEEERNGRRKNLLWRRAVRTGAGGKADRPARLLVALACNMTMFRNPREVAPLPGQGRLSD